MTKSDSWKKEFILAYGFRRIKIYQNRGMAAKAESWLITYNYKHKARERKEEMTWGFKLSKLTIS